MFKKKVAEEASVEIKQEEKAPKKNTVATVVKYMTAVLVVGVLFWFGFVCQVREGSCAVILRFGAVREEITEAGVKVTDLKSGETSVIDADAVVLSVGIRPEETVAEQFEAAFDHVVRVGDAEKAANISEALRAAHDKAWVF